MDAADGDRANDASSPFTLSMASPSFSTKFVHPAEFLKLSTSVCSHFQGESIYAKHPSVQTNNNPGGRLATSTQCTAQPASISSARNWDIGESTVRLLSASPGSLASSTDI